MLYAMLQLTSCLQGDVNVVQKSATMVGLPTSVSKVPLKGILYDTYSTLSQSTERENSLNLFLIVVIRSLFLDALAHGTEPYAN